MKKPEKKEMKSVKPYHIQEKDKGYNQACDDWEKWIKQTVADVQQMDISPDRENRFFWERIIGALQGDKE